MAKKAPPGAVTSFGELHHRLSSYGKGWIFRGHADVTWELVPKVGRKPYIGHEEILFESWKRRAAEHIASHIALNDWEWLAIGQHHRLAMRLLDWTTNPLNAAYFEIPRSSPPGMVRISQETKAFVEMGCHWRLARQ